MSSTTDSAARSEETEPLLCADSPANSADAVQPAARGAKWTDSAVRMLALGVTHLTRAAMALQSSACRALVRLRLIPRDHAAALYDWQSDPAGTQRWEALRPALAKLHYKLWRLDEHDNFWRDSTEPPQYLVRMPHRMLPDRVYYSSTVIATATSPTGHEVVLKLLQFGPPTSALFACRKMCTPPHCYHPSNHALPMLDELHLSDMTIGVFPCVSDQHFFAPTFSSLAEVLSCCWQLLEGLAFFHQHRVVHRDIERPNIKTDVAAFRSRGNESDTVARIDHWRTGLRYTYIDLQLSKLLPDGDPMLRGPPSPHYARAVPPEVRSGEPYDAYKVDVWQLGTTLLRAFWGLHKECPPLMGLLYNMTLDDPAARPTAVIALGRCVELQNSLSTAALLCPVAGLVKPNEAFDMQDWRRRCEEMDVSSVWAA